MVGSVNRAGDFMADWFVTHEASIAAARPGDADAFAPVYATALGALYHGMSEEVLRSPSLSTHAGRVQLVMTSPPFPLNTKKAYGNRTQDEYVSWFADFAPLLREMVTEDGSIVIEIGNAWMPGKPVMSTHVLKAFPMTFATGARWFADASSRVLSFPPGH